MRRFRPGLRMSISVALFVPLTVGLGFWQISRGEQKRAIEEARFASFGDLPIDETHIDSAPAYARIRLEGHYDASRQFLIDNQTRHGAPGYAVVTPFESTAGRWLLVNRGWIAAPAERAELPEAAAPAERVRIVGAFWTISSDRVDRSRWSDGWPKRIEQFDGKRMSEAIGGAIPVEFRIEEGEPGGLEPIVLGEEMTATRHYGYAVQWFAMAFALVVAFVVLGFRAGRGA